MQTLVEQLARAVESAPKGNKVVTIHLFGIDHAQQLGGLILQQLAEQAGIGESFGTELRKGVRLAEFVERRR